MRRPILHSCRHGILRWRPTSAHSQSFESQLIRRVLLFLGSSLPEHLQAAWKSALHSPLKGCQNEITSSSIDWLNNFLIDFDKDIIFTYRILPVSRACLFVWSKILIHNISAHFSQLWRKQIFDTKTTLTIWLGPKDLLDFRGSLEASTSLGL